MRKPGFWEQLFTQAGLFTIGLFVLIPIWGLGRLAFDGAIKGAPTKFMLIPAEFTLDVFRKVWFEPSQSLSVPGLLQNSILVAGGATLFSLILGASMAYAFARFRFPGRNSGMFLMLVGAFMPPVAVMTPLYILLSILGLRTTLFGLMIVYAAFSMPFMVWSMRSAFQAVPFELEEAAYLDGASMLLTFLRISLPLALPSIAVGALMAFLMGYTEFAIGWLFVESSENVTLAMAISGMMQGGSVVWSQLSALALLMSIPVVVLFLFLHRYLLRGLLVGLSGD